MAATKTATIALRTSCISTPGMAARHSTMTEIDTSTEQMQSDLHMPSGTTPRGRGSRAPGSGGGGGGGGGGGDGDSDGCSGVEGSSSDSRVLLNAKGERETASLRRHGGAAGGLEDVHGPALTRGPGPCCLCM